MKKRICVSSSIQTILSVSEFHRFGAFAFADYTAGGELHPALKIFYLVVTRIARQGFLVKKEYLCYSLLCALRNNLCCFRGLGCGCGGGRPVCLRHGKALRLTAG